MAPDSQTDRAQDEAAIDPAFAATSDSMQNLLAQYFERNFEIAPATEPEAPRVAPSRLNIVTSPQVETRTVEAFAALTRHISANGHDIDPAELAWPAAARTMVQSLRQENEHLREQLQQARQDVQEARDLADRDVLTPTLNRRAFLREVHRAMADCRRYGEEACILYLDMDGFKSINDTYGHGAGDAALIHTAETLQASIREGDSVGRMGGDEFAVLLRRADLASSRIKALKLEAELALSTFEYNGLYLTTGGSFGVRTFAGQPTAEAWLSEADAAMFLVKKSSR